MNATRKTSPDHRKPPLRSDERGAALVEFLVALMPLMITFFSFVQLAQITTARLIVKHATIVGARAAAVISNVNHNTPDQQGDGAEDIREAVRQGLGRWKHNMARVDVTVDDQSSCSGQNGQYGLVTVDVKADYKCSVPFGRSLICKGSRHNIGFKIGFPHQGARYKEGGGAQCQ